MGDKLKYFLEQKLLNNIFKVFKLFGSLIFITKWGFMTLEQVEVQIAEFLNQAKKMQIKAQQLQRQGSIVVLQSEVIVREKFNEFFEEGLTLLGKGIIKGRKIKEMLVAEAHRKTANLKKVETTSTPTHSKPFVEPKKAQSKFIKTSGNIKSQKPFNNINDKKVIVRKVKSKPNKSATHYVGSVRAR